MKQWWPVYRFQIPSEVSSPEVWWIIPIRMPKGNRERKKNGFCDCLHVVLSTQLSQHTYPHPLRNWLEWALDEDDGWETQDWSWRPLVTPQKGTEQAGLKTCTYFSISLPWFPRSFSDFGCNIFQQLNLKTTCKVWTRSNLNKFTNLEQHLQVQC